jgi:hypothetical protein
VEVPLVPPMIYWEALDGGSPIFVSAMSKKSDQHERYVASSLNVLKGVEAARPVKGTDYSDVLVDYKGHSAWLEIKMTHKDNLANPRVYFNKKAWKTRAYTPVGGIIVQELNKSQVSRAFVENLADFSDIPLHSIFIPSTRGELNSEENVVPRETMKRYCTINSKYVYDVQDTDLSDIVTLHYTKGKTEPAYYMQAGDDFYRISNTNPLGLSNDIPLLEGTGKFRVRVSNRSKFYEVQAEIKMRDLVSSQFSVLPGSQKQNPFM